jgi:hypothetical protein
MVSLIEELGLGEGISIGVGFSVSFGLFVVFIGNGLGGFCLEAKSSSMFMT